MLVKDYMTRHPITVQPDTTVMEAQRIMAENSIKHLPVLDDNGQLVGVLTPSRFSLTPEKFASLRDFEIIHYLTKSAVKDVMVKGSRLRTISPEATLEEASNMMIVERVTGLPVLDDDMLVGIITQGDLLRELRNLLGAGEDGWRVTIEVPNRKGEFEKIFRSLYNRGWGIMAMGSVRSPRHPDKWYVLVKVSRCEDKEELLEALRSIKDQDMLDIRQVELPIPE
jgi:acetoin utilization protein AcuB